MRPGPSAASGAEASVWPLLLPPVAGAVWEGSVAAGEQWPYILGGWDVLVTGTLWNRGQKPGRGVTESWGGVSCGGRFCQEGGVEGSRGERLAGTVRVLEKQEGGAWISLEPREGGRGAHRALGEQPRGRGHSRIRAPGAARPQPPSPAWTGLSGQDT